MNKRIYSILIALVAQFFLLAPAIGQFYTPVTWSNQANATGNGEYTITFTAEIEPGWYVYSQEIGDDGPVPTSFIFDENDDIELLGKTEERGKKVKEGFDKMFSMDIKKYGEQAVFTQKVKVTAQTKLTGYFTFMTCDDEKCLPPEDVNFDFALAMNSEADKPANSTPPDNNLQNEKPGKSGDLNQQGNSAISEGGMAASTGLGTNSDQFNISFEEENKATDAEGADGEYALQNTSDFLDPVDWEIEIEQLSGKTIALKIKAVIEEGWYIYSQKVPDNGPVATTFSFEDSDQIELVGDVVEVGKKTVEGYDKIFEMDIKKFAGEAIFTQQIKVLNPEGQLTGFLEFMTCDEGRCLPPKYIDYRVDLSTMKAEIGENLNLPATDEVAESEPVSGYYDLPVDYDNPIATCAEVKVKESSSLWKLLILGFFGGLIALLTPCVFPMIPLTVSFFTKSSENKKKGILNATMYGLFILIIYVLLSVPFHLMDSINPDILNEISTNVVLNIVFFVIFIIFAFSFFGYYEITMPSRFTNKVDSASDIGGAVGIFFMALTLSLVSFSCTGPILGSLLAGALTSSGGAFQLTAGMAGFGLALALPFALFAAFPGWLNTLPKSGGWLNTVKVVLGFAELALAFKFLSNADLVKHWGLLKIEPFLIIWILCGIGLALYLFGKIKFPHDSPIKKLGFLRVATGVLTIAFVVYLASGFRYNKDTETFRSLTLLSGLAPPVGYSWIYPKDCPQNINCFKDYYEGLAYAKKHNRPILVDFTGHACVNCRKMEENVWSQKEVNKRLSEDFVLISLYVDDKDELPEVETITYEQVIDGELQTKTRVNRTLGNRWSFLQQRNFRNNSQPWYVMLTPDQKMLSTPVGYTPDTDEYLQFLECGYKAFTDLDGLAESN